MSAPQAHWLPDGRRLHLHHGPIDLILEAWGAPEARAAAYAAAHSRFLTLLAELTAELRHLRSPAPHAFAGPVAQAMHAAVAPFRPAFITPMAAVAGAVADEILAGMTRAAPLARAYVNNGGDIALHLAPGETLTAAGPATRTCIAYADPVRGIATSGWRGRSFSLGIADAVTVLARTAAEADAAATMIANEVDLPGHPAVARAPADSLQHDTDLGARLVTVAVAPLAPADIARALDRGRAAAESLVIRGLVTAAALLLQGEVRTTGPLPLTTRETEIAHA